MQENGFTAGVDEAGRGPVIGPMVMACVVLDENGKKELLDLNVRDSKKVAVSRREKLEPQIKEIACEYQIAKVQPGDIDYLRRKHSLNAIEAMKAAELISMLKQKPYRVYLDAVDSSADYYHKRVMYHLRNLCFHTKAEYKPRQLVSEHKADDNYVEVGAASILAKVERDRVIEKIKEDYGDFGSGYPSDERTAKFIAELLKKDDLPSFVRKSWSTLEKNRQSRLGDF